MKAIDLKKMRESLGLSMNALARQLGIAPSTISRYEAGTLPTPRVVELALRSLKKKNA